MPLGWKSRSERPSPFLLVVCLFRFAPFRPLFLFRPLFPFSPVAFFCPPVCLNPDLNFSLQHSQWRVQRKKPAARREGTASTDASHRCKASARLLRSFQGCRRTRNTGFTERKGLPSTQIPYALLVCIVALFTCSIHAGGSHIAGDAAKPMQQRQFGMSPSMRIHLLLLCSVAVCCR